MILAQPGRFLGDGPLDAGLRGGVFRRIRLVQLSLGLGRAAACSRGGSCRPGVGPKLGRFRCLHCRLRRLRPVSSAIALAACSAARTASSDAKGHPARSGCAGRRWRLLGLIGRGRIGGGLGPAVGPFGSAASSAASSSAGSRPCIFCSKRSSAVASCFDGGDLLSQPLEQVHIGLALVGLGRSAAEETENIHSPLPLPHRMKSRFGPPAIDIGLPCSVPEPRVRSKP